MFQKFNLIVLALLLLVVRNFTSSWPAHFHEVVAWTIPRLNGTAKLIPPSSGDERFVLSPSVSPAHPISSSGLEIKFPDNFADQKFLRFKVQLLLSKQTENFHLTLRDGQGLELCQVELGNDGKVWIVEKVGNLERREQVGVITVKPEPMDLVVGVNTATAEMLISVDGAACRPLYVLALDTKVAARAPGAIQTVGLEFTPSATAGAGLPGRLLHLSLDEAGGKS
jgi:hypothetical protein